MPYVNANCFADPGDQQPGNAPRYFSNLRSDGIHSTDISLERIYKFGDRGQIEIHGDCLNCTNTERFGLPDVGYGRLDVRHHLQYRNGSTAKKHAARRQVSVLSNSSA